ncbi:hypothetical protein S83_048828, partial [Arachis hypogaea]
SSLPQLNDSSGKQLAEDVDFEKLVFLIVGFSGADIRNLVNEAAIMMDIVDVLDKQLLEGMGVLLTKEEQQKCEESVHVLPLVLLILNCSYLVVSVKATMDRYKKSCSDSSGAGFASEINVQ